MDLGHRIRQARQEAGLSQKQICQGLITRNMLSQIENGTAKPSMATLQQLAARLNRPISYFLGEAPQASPNQACILQARQETGQLRLQTLDTYQGPDPLLDPERWLLEALTCLELAQTAILENRLPYARALLDQAKAAGEKTPYYTQDTERRRLLLCFDAGCDAAPLAAALASEDGALLLRACAALEEHQPEAAGKFLSAVQNQTPRWHYLQARMWEMLENFPAAISCYEQAESLDPKGIYGCLERCHLATGDYKQAYFYACKQR